MDATQTAVGRCVWVVGLGFLGSALAAELRCLGRRVIGIDPSVSGADWCCRAADVPVPQEQDAPGCVFCCMATHGGDAADYATCYVDTVSSLERTAPQARVVLCSSLSVYDVGDGRLTDEDAPLRMDSGRVAALLAAESSLRVRGCIVARMAALYGEGRCELLRRHLAGEPRLPGPAERVLNYLHRDDAVSALLCLAEKGGAGQVYNVCGESLCHAEAYGLLERCTGRAASRTCSAPSRRGLSHLRADCTRLQALGWQAQRTLACFFSASV